MGVMFLSSRARRLAAELSELRDGEFPVQKRWSQFEVGRSGPPAGGLLERAC
jgi:hypothetical protein